MKISRCALCNSENLYFAGDLLSSPLANNLCTTIDDSLKAERFPLGLAVCQVCMHVQLSFTVDNRILFDQYFYESGISTTMRRHFDDLAGTLSERFNSEICNRVLDIGSNDGSLLDSFLKHGYKTYGIEPAKNLADKTCERHKIFNGYFGTDLIKKYRELSEFSIITANNVFAHTRSLGDFAGAASIALSENGVFVFEVQYLKSLLEHGLFDMMYHEHTSYHHLRPLVTILPKFGLYVFDAELIQTHGGSIRVYCSKNQNRVISKRAQLILKSEEIYFNDSLNSLITRFITSSQQKLTSINETIVRLAEEGRRIIAYSAPAKATTMISGLSIEARSFIEFIVDEAPFKIGRYIPGTRIPVVKFQKLMNVVHKTDPHNRERFVCVIFAWNIAYDLIEKINNMLPEGTSVAFLIPLPTPSLV